MMVASIQDTALAAGHEGALAWHMQHAENMGLGVGKPFSSPIFLLDADIAGTSHIRGVATAIATLSEGDRLLLHMEASNAFDESAIRIEDAQGHKLGFVPADKNTVLSRLMDGGKVLYATFESCEQHGNWSKVHVNIFMDD